MQFVPVNMSSALQLCSNTRLAHNMFRDNRPALKGLGSPYFADVSMLRTNGP